MKSRIGLLLVAVILSLSISARAQSGANRQKGDDKKSRQTTTNQTNQQPQTETPSNEVVPEDDIVRVDTNLVTIPVTVVDRDGRFVPALVKEDFQVFENGKLQDLAYFAPVEQPFTVALVLDMSRSTAFKIDQIQTAAYQFVMGLRPKDKVLVVAFDEEVLFLSEPTNDRETLRLAINKTRFGGGTSLYEAVYQTIERMKKINGRKAVVLFTDGVDTTSRKTNDADNLALAEEFEGLIYTVRYDTYQDVQNQMSQVPILNPVPIPGAPPVSLPPSTPTIPGTNLPFPTLPPRRQDPQTRRDPPYPNDPQTQRDPRYPSDPTDPRNRRDDQNVIVTGGGATSAEYRRAKEYLDKLAINTGGRLYEANSALNLSRAFEQIAEELRRQYSLGYYPQTEGSFGERRKINVKVNRKKVSVRARDGYTVGRKKDG